MAKAKEQQESTNSGTRYVTYPGPHTEIVLRNVPDVGELALTRGVATLVSTSIADDLIKRKKVKASTEREIKALDGEEPKKEKEPETSGAAAAAQQ